jgi:tetratricopeptide (TPR) repeat protein
MHFMPIPLLRSACLALALALGPGFVLVAKAIPAPQTEAAAAARPADPPADLETLRQQALQESEAGQTEEAIRDYQLALQLQPDWKEGLWNLGMLQYGGNQYAAACSTFQKVAALVPHLGIAWSLLGLSEYEAGNYGNALAHLEKAQSLGIKGDDEVARVSDYHLGILWISAGEFERASSLLLPAFGSGVVSPQAKIAIGLAMLRVPLLPQQLDPSREALVLAAGTAAIAGSDEPTRLAALLVTYPEIPYLHYAYGLALAKSGKGKEALAQLLAETKISPASPFPWLEIARLQLRQGAVNESLKASQKALRLAPGNKDARQILTQAWIVASPQEKAAVDKKLAAPTASAPPVPEQRIVLLYGNASAAAKPATAPDANPGANPDANQDRLRQAFTEYMANQFSASSADLKTWLASNPQDGTAWAMLGICEFQLKDFDNALIHLDRGVKFGMKAPPESQSLARYNDGVLLVHAGRFDEATEVLTAAADAAGPLATKVEFALGLALLRRPEFPDATPERQSSLVAGAGHIAELLEKSNYDEAFPQFKLLLEKYPATPFLHYAYGTALIALSKFDEAAAQMQAEAVLSPTSELPFNSLASIALRQHDAPTALTWAQKALALAPNSVDAHYLLGRASLETGDLDAAIRELELATKLSPASPEIHFNLAKAYARAKMPDKAQQQRDIFSTLSEAQKPTAAAPAPR